MRSRERLSHKVVGGRRSLGPGRMLDKSGPRVPTIVGIPRAKDLTSRGILLCFDPNTTSSRTSLLRPELVSESLLVFAREPDKVLVGRSSQVHQTWFLSRAHKRSQLFDCRVRSPDPCVLEFRRHSLKGFCDDTPTIWTVSIVPLRGFPPRKREFISGFAVPTTGSHNHSHCFLTPKDLSFEGDLRCPLGFSLQLSAGREHLPG